MASMIEQEAKVDEDRAKIARVIYNRLFVGMPLQIDATPLLRAGLRDAVQHAEGARHAVQHVPPLGLPPTPIANPGGSRSRPR